MSTSRQFGFAFIRAKLILSFCVLRVGRESDRTECRSKSVWEDKRFGTFLAELSRIQRPLLSLSPMIMFAAGLG